MPELEQKRFRLGENTNRALGGNISPEPFPQALYRLALSRGFESQKVLARALGHKYHNTVGDWYRGNHTPDPESLGQLLILFQPNNEELDSLLNPYGELIREVRERGIVRMAEAHRKPRSSPFDKWVEDYCIMHHTTMSSLTKLLGFQNHTSIRPQKQETGLGLDVFSQILQNGSQALNLSPKETDVLSEAVATTIEQQIATGHKFKGNNHLLAKKLQKEFACRTYTPAQAAKELGITREYVRQLRNKLGLPLLLTEDQLKMLKTR